MIFGLGYTSVEQGDLEIDKFEPKAGVEWRVTDRLRLRAAFFDAVKGPLIVDQTIEPTEIAGFNQFFDDASATKTKRVGVGLDLKLTDQLFAGIEASRREIDFPLGVSEPIRQEQRREKLFRGYLYWAISSRWIVTVDPAFEQFSRDALDFVQNVPVDLDTLTVPVSLRYFAPWGMFGQLRTTYLRQDLKREDNASLPQGDDDSILLDAALGYRLPKRRGILSVEVQNILGENFFFQDDNFRSPPASTRVAEFVPDRRFLLRATLSF